LLPPPLLPPPLPPPPTTPRLPPPPLLPPLPLPPPLLTLMPLTIRVVNVLGTTTPTAAILTTTLRRLGEETRSHLTVGVGAGLEIPEMIAAHHWSAASRSALRIQCLVRTVTKFMRLRS
jgi:hypothetical protein